MSAALFPVMVSTGEQRGVEKINAASVFLVIEQSIRSTPSASTLKFIDGQRELRYDRDASIRDDEFAAHYIDQDIAAKFVV